MQPVQIALEAARRWDKRQKTREKNRSRIEAGNVVAAETPKRIRLRLERLSRASSGTSGTLRVIDNPPLPAGVVLPPLGEAAAQERVLGQADFLGVSFLELALAVSRFTGRICIRTGPGRLTGYGTGFMVSPRLLLTNHHVLPSRQEAAYSQVEFDYQRDRFGRLQTVRTFGLLPGDFFLTSPELDFTLVAVQERNADGLPVMHYGWTRLIGAQGKALLGEALNIVQHPRGDVKQVVLRSNHLVDLFDDYAHYVTDTEPGSSGSPVYNDQWELVALHHSGVPRIVDGQLIARDGSVWQEGMDPEMLDWVANEGIRASSLVMAIEQAHLEEGLARRLRDDLLNLEPPSPLEAAYRAAEDAGPASSGSATYTWTIPLQISLQIGPPTGSPGAPSVPQVTVVVSSGGDQPAPAPSGPPAPPQDEPTDPDYDAAVARARDAARRDYYDEDKDALACSDYYQGIQPGVAPQELYGQLNTLVKETHTRPLNYKPALHVYPWVDLHERDGAAPVLRSLYSGKEFEPLELIEADFAVERARRQLAESLALGTAFGALRVAEQLDLLEASLPYNCEHVVPQSWFDKREPMRGDLHHLFACEAGCNSFRGNIPYYDFPDFMEVVREECGKREGLRFEPVENKGVVARATLYFLLRYPGLINRSENEYPEERLALLLAWHQNHPVSRYEKHRNAAIFEMQGNRNPLIDHPEWAGEIDFRLGLGN